MNKAGADKKCILEIRRKVLRELRQEESVFKSYKDWQDSLKDFREAVYRKYIKYKTPWNTYRVKKCFTISKHYIDHHILSYLAPLDYKRIGWGGVRRTPSEQIIFLADYFRKRGIRFIYAPLPNKGMIYPEILNLDISVEDLPFNYPQYRKYIREIVNNGVELVDLFPVFQEEKKKGRNLFTYAHHISAAGVQITAESIADYLQKTCRRLVSDFRMIRHNITVPYTETDYPVKDNCFEQEVCMCLYPKSCADTGFLTVPYYNQESDESPIAVIGDCNLQNYESYGAGISANLAARLSCPVYNAGRYLPFHQGCCLDRSVLEMLCRKEIIIYTAFASAGFVRTSELSVRNFGLPGRWSTFQLE